MAAIGCFHDLKKLVLRNWPVGANFAQAEAIGSLTRLEHLEITLEKDWSCSTRWAEDGFYTDSSEDDFDWWQFEDPTDTVHRFSRELAKLTCLHTLALRGNWPVVLALPHLTGLCRLEYNGERIPPFQQAITNLASLTALTALIRGGSSHISVLHHVSGLTALRRLKLLDRAFPLAVSSLTGLTLLELRLGCISQDRIEERFGAVLPRLAALETLHLEVMHLEMLPDALVQMTHLTELRLERCSLPGLPRGPYLRNLRILSLAGNVMQRLPAALATATALESLDISEMDVQLGRQGKRLLHELPALRLVFALAAPRVVADGPLRLANELYKVNKLRQLERPQHLLEVHVSRNDSDTSTDDERSSAFSDEAAATESDVESVATTV